MHQKILLPLDGSKTSESVLPYVNRLLSSCSEETDKTVIMLQVLPAEHSEFIGGYDIPHMPYNEPEIKSMKERSEAYLKEKAILLAKQGVKIETRVEFGEPIERIVEVAEKADVDFIAMSTHGRSGISRWAMGSVADGIIRQDSDIPVFLVRSRK